MSSSVRETASRTDKTITTQSGNKMEKGQGGEKGREEERQTDRQKDIDKERKKIHIIILKESGELCLGNLYMYSQRFISTIN